MVGSFHLVDFTDIRKMSPHKHKNNLSLLKLLIGIGKRVSQLGKSGIFKVIIF